jgi:hypothetical protein
MFFDLNNVQIADIASKWFADRGSISGLAG